MSAQLPHHHRQHLQMILRMVSCLRAQLLALSQPLSLHPGSGSTPPLCGGILAGSQARFLCLAACTTPDVTDELAVAKLYPQHVVAAYGHRSCLILISRVSQCRKLLAFGIVMSAQHHQGSDSVWCLECKRDLVAVRAWRTALHFH